ncbi:stevor PIR protein,putative [Plasmodium sp.]|nr:stevor PIR protein,putative [Plasmodium sp.]
MISYNFKLIIFSIIIGASTLIHNNYRDALFKNTKNRNMVLVSINFRSLAEISYEPRTYHKHENNVLKEYKKTNEKKLKKNIYAKNNTKPKDKITEKKNIGTSNLKKCTKEKYDKEKEAKSNRTSCFLKYLGTLRKKICNLFVKKNKDSLNLSDKSITENDKSRERPNKKKSSDKLSSSSKDHDKNLINLETACVGGAYACTVPTAFVVKWGIEAGIAAAETYVTAELATISAPAMTEALGINIFFEPAITNYLTCQGISTLDSAVSIASASWTGFTPYGIAALI